jgi:hypothetical protein
MLAIYGALPVFPNLRGERFTDFVGLMASGREKFSGLLVSLTSGAIQYKGRAALPINFPLSTTKHSTGMRTLERDDTR